MKLITKLVNLQKNSFTLIETLISITILSVVVTIFNKISHDNLREDISYNLLNDLENIFATKSYSNLQKSFAQKKTDDKYLFLLLEVEMLLSSV